MGEWRAFEREYGPLLVHERVDWGLAVLRTQGDGGGDIKLPPWYDQDEGLNDDQMFAWLEAMSRKGEAERGG